MGQQNSESGQLVDSSLMTLFKTFNERRQNPAEGDQKKN